MRVRITHAARVHRPDMMNFSFPQGKKIASTFFHFDNPWLELLSLNARANTHSHTRTRAEITLSQKCICLYNRSNSVCLYMI